MHYHHVNSYILSSLTLHIYLSFIHLLHFLGRMSWRFIPSLLVSFILYISIAYQRSFSVGIEMARVRNPYRITSAWFGEHYSFIYHISFSFTFFMFIYLIYLLISIIIFSILTSILSLLYSGFKKAFKCVLAKGGQLAKTVNYEKSGMKTKHF